ncbi:hypothetical protein HQ447_11865 [bacterium]|nr:hypothetical protein [bacterium]
MKPFTFFLFLSATLGAAEPAVTSAAKTKPSSPWQDYPTRLVRNLPDYQAGSDGAAPHEWF